MEGKPVSRLFVRNLPKHVEEKDLVKEFSKIGEITDCKVIRNERGKSRCIAYLGYKSVEEADKAKKYFDGTYMLSRKISVEFAIPIGEKQLDDTWARRKKFAKIEKQQEKQIEKFKRENAHQPKEKFDPAFQEFLAAHKPRQMRATWNDGFGFEEQYQDQKESSSDEEQNENTEEEENAEEKKEKTEEKVTKITTPRLYVKNIPYSSTAEQIKAKFEEFGPVEEVSLPASEVPGENRGFAFVKFADIESATKAYMTSVIFEGRHLQLAQSEPEPEKKKVDLIPDDDQSFQEKKQERLKRYRPETMNPLIMDKNTIADAIAERIGVTKADVLNPESDNVMARLAIAESQLVEETKQLFAQHGIDVDALQNGYKQDKTTENSNTVLIIKNLRYETTEEELRGILASKGTLVRFVLAPTHTVAIVEYARPSDARKAFNSLNYWSLHETPIYMQWAPAGVTTNEGDGSDERKSRRPKVEIKTTTLIVKNLPFSVTKKSEIAEAFKHVGNIKAIRLTKKRNEQGHRGFCFIDFTTRQAAQAAYDAMQDVHLADRHLIVQPADEGKRDTKVEMNIDVEKPSLD